MKIPLLNDFTKYFHDDLWIDVAKQICAEHEMHFHDIRRSEHGENIVFLLDTDYVLKIYTRRIATASTGKRRRSNLPTDGSGSRYPRSRSRAK